MRGFTPPHLTDIPRKTGAWAVASLCLNLMWEIAQLPLYTIPSAQSATRIASAVAHCTVGDVVLAVMSFVMVVLILGDPDWTVSQPWRSGSIVTLFGVAYTAYSEWYNVYRVGDWGYSSNMPLVFGIGLSPLLQWIFIPIGTVLIIGTRRATR